MATTIQTIEVPKKARALDTSGNNNHGQIYSGRGLEFDGIGDYIHTPLDGNPGNFGNQSDFETTIAFWVKVNDFVAASAFMQWARTGHVSDGTPFVLLALNGTDGSSRLYVDGDYRNLTHKFKAETWYRFVVTRTASDNTWRVYINGVADVTHDDSGTPNNQANADSFYLGTGYNRYFSGAFSNAQVWNKAFTQADVTYDYLNPESLALNASGTALTESNLKLWYPMQDGHRGQQSYILDGANSGIGDELITNGDFATDISGWSGSTSRGSYAWDNGRAKITNDAADGYPNLYQNPTTETGKVYKVTATVEIGTASTIEVRIYDGATLGSQQLTTGGEVEFYFTAVGTTPSLHLYLFEAGNTGNYCYFDNISVKPINDKNHATTVFHGDELVTNGTFTSATTGWQGNDAAAGISIVSSRLRVTNGDASAAGFSTTSGSPTFSTITGRTYLISYDSLQGTSANPNTTLFLGTSFNGSEVHTGTTYTSDGTHTYTFTATASQDVYLLIKNVTTTNGQYMDYDNVSIKEVGVASGWTDADQQLHIPQTALQSYNELAWMNGFDDGTDSDISCGSDTSIDDIFDGGGTFSGWILPNGDGAGGYGRIFDKGNNYLYLQSESGSTIRMVFASINATTNTVSRTTNYDIKYGQWQHVAVTYNSTTPATQPILYINGVATDVTETTEGSGTRTSDAGGTFHLGNNSSGTRTFEGSITEASLWEEILTATEILELYNDGKALDATSHSQADELKAYWRNNGLSTWTDLSTNSNDGTVNNITETILIPQGVDSTRDAQGFIMNKQKDTSSLNLTTRPSDYVEAPADGSLDFGTGDFSIECWVQYGFINNSVFGLTGSSLNVILSNGIASATSVDGFNLLVNSADFVVRIGDGTNNSPNNSYTIPGTPVVGNWYHVVVTRASTVIETYIDGDDVGGATHADWAVNVSTDDSLLIGNDKGGHRDYKWPIDNVRIYSKALSSTEVLRNYNATKGSHRN